VTSDSQSQAENLDDDRLAGDYPPDQPLGAEDYGTTPAEERVDEPLRERIWREEPEQEPAGPAVAGRPAGSPGPLEEGDPAAGDPTLRDVATEHEGPGSPEDEALHVERP
jgi:hypothetical protein